MDGEKIFPKTLSSEGKPPEWASLIRELRTLNKLLSLLIELLAYDEPTESLKLASEARSIIRRRRRHD